MNHGSTNHASQTGQLENSKHLRNIRKYIAEHLIPEDNPHDTDYHKYIRPLTEQPNNTINERDFNQDEVRRTIEGFNPKKAPGPDGIIATF
jgi:hypothetical protein